MLITGLARVLKEPAGLGIAKVSFTAITSVPGTHSGRGFTLYYVFPVTTVLPSLPKVINDASVPHKL